MNTLSKLFLAVVSMVFVFGCAPALQMGIGILGNATGAAIEDVYKSGSTPSASESGLVLGNQTDSLEVGNYQVRMSEANFKGKACIVFIAYNDNDVLQNWIGFLKEKQDSMRQIDAFKQMTLVGKKQFLKQAFLAQRFDLGPVEQPPAENPSELAETKPIKTSPAAPSSYVPTTSFAPKF